ncbi:MAG: hypothetical protein U1F16_08690 [Turneriella sp.]
MSRGKSSKSLEVLFMVSPLPKTKMQFFRDYAGVIPLPLKDLPGINREPYCKTAGIFSLDYKSNPLIITHYKHGEHRDYGEITFQSEQDFDSVYTYLSSHAVGVGYF